MGTEPLLNYDFIYVDFASKGITSFRNNIVPVNKIEELTSKYKDFDCYSTYFLFNQSGQKITDLKGPIWANYLPIDIDSAGDLDKAHKDTKTLVDFLLNKLNIDAEGILIYFSGNSGFHIMIDVRCFGEAVRSSKILHIMFDSFRHRLNSALKLETLDFSIKDRSRLWRLPNTKNTKSGLYKVQLSIKQLYRLSIEQIKEYAISPNIIINTDATGLLPMSKVEVSTVASKFYVAAINYALEKIEKNKQYRDTQNSSTQTVKGICLAVVKMLSEPLPEGHRNNICLRIASKCRLGSISQQATINLLLQAPTGLAEEELSATVKSVFQRESCYKFGCKDQIMVDFCEFRDNRKDCPHIIQLYNKPEQVSENKEAE